MGSGPVFEAAVRDLPPCLVCGAAKGDPCRTTSWRTRHPHKGRVPQSVTTTTHSEGDAMLVMRVPKKDQPVWGYLVKKPAKEE